MHKALVTQLKPGEKLGKTIYNERGDVLLMRGAGMTDRTVRSMLDRGFGAVFVLDGIADDVEPHEIISEHLRDAATANVRGMHDLLSQASREQRHDAARHGAHVLNDVRIDVDKRTETQVKSLYGFAEAIVSEVLETDLLLGIGSLKSHDSYTFQHSVDVSVYGVMLGRKMALERDYLRELAIAGLFHDVGKIFIEEQILQKPGRLDEEEMKVVMAHPTLGFKLLKHLQLQTPRPRHVVLQHHERQDGTGYPHHRVGSNQVHRTDRERFDPQRINLMAEIVAVVDVYSALVSDRPYRPAYNTRTVLAELRREAGHHLNAELVDLFLAMLPMYAIGSYVRVRGGRADGHLGIVVQTPEKHANRPIVRLLFDRHGARVPDGLEMDMRGADEDVDLDPLPVTGTSVEEYARALAAVG